MPGPVRVLVADDHAPFRAAVRSLVEATSGFELVAEVEDGAAAIATAEAIIPDLVLMDVRMPDVDGVAATRAIKARRPSTVVVLISTVHPAELRPAARECAAAAIVWKRDLTPAALIELWRRHGADGA